MTGLGPAGRAFLQTLAGCPADVYHLVPTARARYVLVVSRAGGWPATRRATLNEATLRTLHGADLITYLGGQQPLDFTGRRRGDSTTGERVELTEAGWEALGGRATARLDAERRQVVRRFQRYTPQQRAARAASHTLSPRQREAVGEHFYTHPAVPGGAFLTRDRAARAGLTATEATS